MAFVKKIVTIGSLFQLFLHTGIAQVTPPAAYGSSIKVNYVREWSALAPIQDSAQMVTRPVSDVHQTTSYFDGLGRPLQTVQKQISPLGRDMVTAMVYDSFGRESYKYLPFTSTVVNSNDITNDGNIKLDPFQQQAAFSAAQYPGQTYYYGRTDYEASPMNRTLTSYAPGDSWVGGSRGTGMQYLQNATTDSVQIWTIAAALRSLPSDAGTYPAGLLYKSVTTDEAGHQVVEYKDKEGHIVLKKVQLWPSAASGPSGWLNTYYVYDYLSNLRFVMQPKAVDWLKVNNWSFTGTVGDSVNKELCFRYEYDARNRMIIKKVLGAGETWMVYDTRDRVVMTQDSLLRGQHKWLFTRYDGMNRADSAGLITDPTNYNNLSYHLALAAVSTNYPVVGSYTNELLTQTYYDDYNWTGGSPSGVALNGASQAKFNSTYNTAPDYAVAPVAYMITQGLATGTKIKVLGTTSTFLQTLQYYDDHGRVVQTQETNYTGATDTITTQYNFSGQPLRTLLNHQKAGNTAQHHDVLTRMNYDAGQRLKNVWKNIDGTSSDQLIDSMQYDQLGQVQAKYLGSAVDSLVYTYNIRGWLTSINKNYLTGAARHYFGMELGYNNATPAVAGTTYSPQYNGNISGTIWKGGGDGINRKYDFSYDTVNRLTAASFTQNTTGATWDSSTVNFSTSHLTYDANGNILTMNQAGLKVNSSSLIDQLTYWIPTASNKLLQVRDVANDSLSVLGDFHYKGSKSSTDYGYDGNGSMTHDNNKGIDTIIYNYLHLPQQVHMKGKGNILYTYDAGGNKLTKVVMDSLSKKATTTLYVNGLVYKQIDTIATPTAGTDTLQFLMHEEGRARWAFHRYTGNTTGYKWEYDFFEKDHLGNTREVLTQQRDTAQYMATMEAAYRATENALFYNIGSTNVWSGYVNGGSNPFGTGVTTPNDSVCRISGSTPKEGPAIILKVMAGDSYRVGVQAYYKSGQTSTGTTDALSDILSSLANGIIGVAGSGKGSYSALSNTTTSPLLAGVNGFRSDKDSTPVSNPKAYLNYMALDDQFNYDPTASGANPVGAPDGLRTLASDSVITIKKNGYLYIYLTNETKSVSVFFDNLSVTTYSGPLLEETHYYPFGLTMAGMSDKALKGNYAENKYKYTDKELQNKEFSDGTGLEEYDYESRFQDPQLGRFTTIDPLSGVNSTWSPYSYAADNPIRFLDPDGRSPREGSTALTSLDIDPNGTIIHINQDGDPGVYMIADPDGPRSLVGFMDPNKKYIVGSKYQHYGKADYYEKWKAGNMFWFITVYDPNDPNPNQNNLAEAGMKVAGDMATLVLLDGLGDIFDGVEAANVARKSTSVIGPRLTYQQFARRIGAKFLDVTNEAWTWAQNEEYLAGVVARGDDVIFAGKFSPNLLDPNSILAREIDYLTEHGYEWTSDFSKLIKK